MDALTNTLQHQFGFSEFRTGQREVVETILAGHSSLAIFPTGSGKSLCYQFCALQLPHVTLVISPLLALMKDQLEFLASKGIAAASIDSSLTYQQAQQVMSDVRNHDTRILMISVERFNNERFRQFLSTIQISLLVVDEAHCISEWGHNFRPDYLKIPQYCQAFNIPQSLLLTATATKKVKLDMAARFSIAESHIIQTGFYRPNLHLQVLPVEEPNKLNTLLSNIIAHQGAGIVYVTLQQTAEFVASFLHNHGIEAVAYHAGMESEIRQKIQQDFMSGDSRVIVATIAFGMGIDKSDIRFVVHFDLPKSIENYSQEIGRAGRDGQLSHCITLANLDGLSTVENFVYGDTPEQDSIVVLLQTMLDESVNNRWEMQELPTSTKTNIRTLPLKTLLVQLELMEIVKPNFAYFAECKYKFVTSEADVLQHFEGERKAFLQAVFASTQFKKVWGQLDFDALYQVYGSDRKRVVAALDYLAEHNAIVLETKKITQVFDVDIDRLQQPSLAGQLADYFKDKENKEILRIAQLVRFFELDKCLSHSLARYFDDQQSPEHCGHCSVCQNQVAVLPRQLSAPMPDTTELKHLLKPLAELTKNKQLPFPSRATQAKFLAGIAVPMLSRLKVKSLSGFAYCQTQRYSDILQAVDKVDLDITD